MSMIEYDEIPLAALVVSIGRYLSPRRKCRECTARLCKTSLVGFCEAPGACGWGAG
jgi:hypothetical protein